MGNLTLRTEVSGPDVSLLAGLVGFDRLPPERFHLVATVRRTGSLLQIDQAELQLPDSALSVRGSVARIDKFAGNDLTIRINGASLEKFRKLLHVPGIATGPFDITGTMHRGQAGEDVLDLAATTTLARVTASGPLGAYPDYFGTRLQFSVERRERPAVRAATGSDERAPGTVRRAGPVRMGVIGRRVARRKTDCRRRYAERRRTGRQSARFRYGGSLRPAGQKPRVGRDHRRLARVTAPALQGIGRHSSARAAAFGSTVSMSPLPAPDCRSAERSRTIRSRIRR